MSPNLVISEGFLTICHPGIKKVLNHLFLIERMIIFILIYQVYPILENWLRVWISLECSSLGLSPEGHHFPLLGRSFHQILNQSPLLIHKDTPQQILYHIPQSGSPQLLLHPYNHNS